MTARRLALLALALLAGCKKTSTQPSLLLAGPAAVAVYQGFSTLTPGLRAYVAVANERGDDLRILDAVDGRAVLAPALIQALSVPTAPRPALLAAGSLHDADPAGKADLLVVASAGLTTCDPDAPDRLAGCVQAVATWTTSTALATRLTVVVDDAILSLAVLPVPEADGNGGLRPAAGRVRVAAGLTGGRLLLADYARSSTADDQESIVLTGSAVHDLSLAVGDQRPFDLLSLSPSPDLRHLYAASLDPIDGVAGVAELDVSGAFDAPPTVRAIPTGVPVGLPTTLVLAARVRPFAGFHLDTGIDDLGPEVIRVYAALDPHQCGPDAALSCGLAVLDPVAGGPIADPAGELPAHQPLPILGQALALGAVYPPALGSLQADQTPSTSADNAVYQKQAMASGFRWTSALAAVATTNGGIFLQDLSRGAPAMDRDLVATTTAGTQASVASAISSPPKTAASPWVGLWDDRPGTTPPPVEPTHDSTVLPFLVDMTVGYTLTETWTLRWEGLLPLASSLRAEVQSTGTTLEWLALQASTTSTPGDHPYREVGRLYDPRMLVRKGDIAIVTPDDTTTCLPGAFELEVTGLLAPDSDLYPGGAVTVVARLPKDQPLLVDKDGNEVPADPSCILGAGSVRSAVHVDFRAGGLVLVGSLFGYAGRPVPLASAAEPAYTLGWEDTSGLSCPVLESSAWPPPPCDQACRDTCERILLARKARRQFYVKAQCPSSDTVCKDRWGEQPLIDPRGPVLQFRPGFVYSAGQALPLPNPARDESLQIVTNSGLALTSRRPLSGSAAVGAALPSGVATFDRTEATGLEASGVRVFASYPTNLVLDFSPANAASVGAVYK